MTNSKVPSGATRMFYIDDSGSEGSGWIVYSWVECAITDWRAGLRAWLDLRKELFVRFAIPASVEIHSTHFASGQGNPSTNMEWNRRKSNRGQAMRLALERIGCCPGLSVGTVYRQTDVRRRGYFAEKTRVYERLVDHLDARLGSAGELGLLFMDGDGTDRSYQQAHRGIKLSDRNIIEDPLFQVSTSSQWVQMADITAWSAFQGLQRTTNRHFAWEWYSSYLLQCDVNGGPIPI